jgi:hypothetical protein
MPLDGLRAWIGEVERKLGVRTRVFLVLAAIAVGGAGAAIVLAVDAQNSAVSDSDVQALQERLEARIAEGAGATSVTQLETELKDLQTQLSELQGGGGSGKSKSGGSSGGSTGGSSGGSTNGTGSQGTGDTGSGSKNLQDLLRQAEEQQK